MGEIPVMLCKESEIVALSSAKSGFKVRIAQI